MFAHNFFGFDIFFLLQGFWATAWNIKDINIRGTNLTNINFANISNETKFTDTLKYYQKSLGQLAGTLSVNEKHGVWKYLGLLQKEKHLNTVAGGKGIIQYKKIIDTNNMSLTPENGILFEKSEFHSDLKQKSVKNEDYDSSLHLYKNLKMRNLGDMNDLYNAQDVNWK